MVRLADVKNKLLGDNCISSENETTVFSIHQMAWYPGNWEHFLTTHFLITMNLHENAMFVHFRWKLLSNKISYFIGQHPPYAGEIWKRSYISTVWPTVHTNPSRKRSFLKTLFKQEKFENARFCFRLDGKRFENGASRQRFSLGNDNHVIPWPSST